jgi:DNA repair protein RecO (recombination protein O)
MAINKTEAIVLKTFDFRETSLVAVFFTKDYGKMSGLFKGIKKEPQKFASTVEPFSHNEVIFYKKKNSTLDLVSQCDLRDDFSLIRKDMSRVGLASSLMELLDAIMPLNDVNPDVFDLALDALRLISNYNYPDKIATIFKIKLLALSGFKPHLDSCISCSNRISGEVRFSISLGGLLCPPCFRKDIRSRTIYRGSAATILHVEKNNLNDNLRLGINPAIKREIDYLLQSFLEHHLDKKLKTQKVLPSLLETGTCP